MLVSSRKTGWVSTLADGFIERMRSFAASVLHKPIFSSVQRICLFKFDFSKVSASNSTKFSIPERTSASRAKPPTPPSPAIRTFEFLSFSFPDFVDLIKSVVNLTTLS